MKRTHHCLLLFTLWSSLTATVHAATVEELAAAIVSSDTPVIIDLRPTSAYRQGHIPGAISMPMAGLEDRKLPPLGDVVAYGDGFGRQDGEHARNVLAGKGGIRPDILEGGYAAWETRSGVTTGGGGMKPERPTMVSYQELKAGKAADIVIHDLRDGSTESGEFTRAVALVGDSESAGGSERIADHFPGAEVRRGQPQIERRSAAVPSLTGGGDVPRRASAPVAGGNPLLKSHPTETDKFIVLIASDYRDAEATARKMRAAGHQRVAVLAGGETILDFGGRPGTERIGGGKVEATDSVDEEGGAASE